jgi:hypothetical protein
MAENNEQVLVAGLAWLYDTEQRACWQVLSAPRLSHDKITKFW